MIYRILPIIIYVDNFMISKIPVYTKNCNKFNIIHNKILSRQLNIKILIEKNNFYQSHSIDKMLVNTVMLFYRTPMITSHLPLVTINKAKC